MKKIYAIFLTLVGAALYRWRGHASKYKKYLPRPFNQILFAVPYAFVSGFWWFLVLPLTTLGVLTGHGRGFPSKKMEGEPETLEFLILWLMPFIPLSVYKSLIMAITGLAVTLPAGIATGNPYIALSGVLKAPAYTIADKMGWGTDGGEWLTGGFLYFALSFYIF